MRSFPIIGSLAVVAGLAPALFAPVRAAAPQDGPCVVATVLRSDREKSFGLAAQLAAMQPIKGRLLVCTNAAGNSAADFEIRFLWRTAKDARSSNEAPTMVAADLDNARRALLAAMNESFSSQAMARVAMESPKSGTRKCWEVIFPSPHSGASLARQFRVARKLVAAQLVAMNMMTPAAVSWPPNFRPAKMLALYDAEGVGYYGSTLLDRAVDETTLDARTMPVCPEDIREGILDRCIGVLFPGGTGRGIAAALHPDGVQRVREFVAKGGGYFGVCAGAYLATSGRPDYTGMIPLKHDQPWEKGKSKLKLALTPEGAALLGAEFSHIETSYHCGPVFRDLAPDGHRAPVTVLANFESPATDAKGVVRNEMTGTPAIMSMPYQKGRIMIVSPHPESQTKFSPLVARAICWTIGQNPKSIQARTASAPHSESVETAGGEKIETESADKKQP